MVFLKNKKWWVGAFTVLCLILISSNSQKTNETSPTPPSEETRSTSSDNTHIPLMRGNRVLGIGVTEGNIGFEKAFAIAQEVGVQAVEIPIFWDEVELNPKTYTETLLTIANMYFPKTGTKIALSLNPIDTNNERVPADLKGKSFNDPEVIERYKSFVNFVSTKVPDSDIFFIAIGNEVDVYLGNSDTKWHEYSEFYAAVAPYVQKTFPRAVVGSKITFAGLTTSEHTEFLTNQLDTIFVTYYPFTLGTFIVKEPEAVHTDFEIITTLFPNKQIFFTEIGYPSGKDNESTESKQAEFIKEAFIAWDTHADQVPFLNFIWLHDLSPKSVRDFQLYYELKEKSFSSFLGTLGLRSYDGKDKPSFKELLTAAKDRGW